MMCTQGNKKVSILGVYMLVHGWGVSTATEIYARNKVFENKEFFIY